MIESVLRHSRFVSGVVQATIVLLALPTEGFAADVEIGVQFNTFSRSEGAMIQRVVAGSPADDAGLRVRSVITHVDGRMVSDAAHFSAMMSAYKPGQSVKLQLLDNNVVKTVNVVLAARGAKYKDPLKTPDYLEAMEEANDVGASMERDSSRPGSPVIALEIDARFVSDRSFDFFRHFTRLQTLTIEEYAADNKFTGTGLQQLKELPDLRSLVLRDWTLKPTFVQQMAHLPGLKSLDLKKCKLEKGALGKLADVTRLEYIDLNGVQISLDDVAAIGRMTSLRSLGLNNTTFRGKSLAEFRQLKHLQHLYIVNTEVTNQDLVHLRELPELVSLGLSGTQVTDRGLAALSHLSRLECLGLSYLKSPKSGNVAEDGSSDGTVTGAVITATEDAIGDGARRGDRNQTVSATAIEKHLGQLSQIRELWIEGPDFEPSDIRSLSRIWPKAKIVTSRKTIFPTTR